MKTAGIYPFGKLSDGTEIEEICLSAHGQFARILTWGAVLRDLTVTVGAVENRRVVLGLNRIEDYLSHSPYFGAIAGRCANRTAGGRFDLDGQTFQLTKNQNGLHHLHGGAAGFGKRVWTRLDHSASHVTLQRVSAEGEEGYPGEVTAQCTYALERTEDHVDFAITLTATTSAPTLVNLAHHSYFNLDASPDIRNHSLKIEASAYLPTDAQVIPTGEIRPVAGSDFDFRTMRPINPTADPQAPTYDHNFVIANERRDSPRQIARLQGGQGLAMDVLSTEPGLQFYDGSRVNVAVAGLTGHPYGAFSGVCLEPQVWPDAQNNKAFPSAVLRPDETYRQQTLYRFLQPE